MSKIETASIVAGGILVTILMWSLLIGFLYFVGSWVIGSVPEEGLRSVFIELWCGSEGCE